MSSDNQTNRKDTVPLDLPSLDLPSIDKERSSNDNFMSDLVKVANEVSKAIILISGIVPQKKIDAEKIEILRGHLVRLYKLYDSFIFLIIERRTEISFIILRSLSETIINLCYLLKHIDTDIHKKYKRSSLAYENKLQDSILKNILERKEKLPIEKRMLKSIKETFSRSGVNNLEEDELRKTKWGLEESHLSISGKAKDVGLYSVYENMFITSSHFVHGSWHEIDFYHLEKNKDSYGARQPQMRYTNSKPQLLDSGSIFVLYALQEYLSAIVENSKYFEEIKVYLNTINEWFYNMVYKHEEFLASKE